jgi:hypothetical protein
MASTYSNSGIELITAGEQSGTWGGTTNNNLEIIDRLSNGVGAITLTGTTYTLSTFNGTLSEGQYAVLVLGGTPSGTNTVTISPNTADHLYFVKNSSGQTVILSQGSGSTVSILNGDTKIVYCDGAGAGAAVTDLTADFSMSSVRITGGDISGVTNSSSTFTSATVTSGTINNVAIGGTTKAAGGFTTLTTTGDSTFGGALVETVYALSGTTPALDPSNGTIQTWTLTGNSTPTSSLAAGESMTLMVDDGTAYTITWPSVTWKTNGGSAPTLNTSGYTVIVLWRVGAVLYGARVGDA